MPSSIKVGIVGYGTSAKVFNIPFILPNPDLAIVAILQRAEAPKDASAAEPGKHCTVDHPSAKHYRTADQFFADAEIELVVVCSSNDTHFDFGQRALNAGKHVLIEKPITLTSAEADRLIALANERKKVLTVYQNRRYDSDFRTLQHLLRLEPSPFGKITEFANHFDFHRIDWLGGWSTSERVPGEGMLYAVGSHTIDQTLLLFGVPESVTAFMRVLRAEDAERAAEDSFTILLQYGGAQKDLVATIKTTVVSPQPEQMSFWLRGVNGSFRKEGEDVQIENLVEFGMKPTDAGFGVEPTRYHGRLHTTKPREGAPLETGVVFSGKVPSQTGSYMDFYSDLVAAIRGEKDLVVRPEQSRNGIRIMELAIESATKGMTVPWSDT